MNKLTKFAATLAATAALLFACATPALAHSADVSGVAECQPDGTYSVVWTGDTYNVPAHEEAEVKVITPENLWLHEWAEHNANHGLTPLAPNASFQWQQDGIPGSATGADVTFQIDWHGHSSDPTGHVDLPGDCSPELPPTYVTPETPEAFTRECYAGDEKPYVVPPADGVFLYTVTEGPLNVFTVAATPAPAEDTYTDVPAAIALGWTPTESQTVTRVFDLSYVKACVTDSPSPAPSSPPLATDAPAPPASVPGADALPERTLPATGISDGWPFSLVAAGLLLVAGTGTLLASTRRRRS